MLDGFDDDGAPRLRPPAAPTTRQLLCTPPASATTSSTRPTTGSPPSTASPASSRVPRPRSHAAALRPRHPVGVRLQHRLGRPGGRGHHRQAPRRGDGRAGLRPLGMTDTAFALHDAMRPRTATMHQRHDRRQPHADGLRAAAEPEVHMGGHGLWSTAPDYLQFIRMWLNDGAGRTGAGAAARDRARWPREPPRRAEGQGAARASSPRCRTTPSSSPACRSRGR